MLVYTLMSRELSLHESPSNLDLYGDEVTSETFRVQS